MKVSKSGVSSWKDISGPEREEALKRGFEENGGWYMKAGGQYVQSRRHLWLPVVFYTDLMLAIFTLVTAGYYSMLKHDMEAASECFHFITMVTNMMIITSCLLYYRNVVDDLFVGIGSGFFDYGDTVDPQTKKKMQTYLMDMRTKKKFRFRVFVLVVWVLGISMLIKVVIAYFRFGDTIDGEGGSVSRKHIVAQWFFGIDKWPNYIAMTFICYGGQICVMNSIWGFVLPVICFAEELTGQLYVVGLGFRNTTTRARYIYKCRYGEFKEVDKAKYAECLREALNSSVQHHNIILEVCNGLRTILFVPLMTVMFGTAVLLCMSGFIMVEDSVPIIAKIISLLFIVGEVIYSAMFCLYGENMTNTSEDIGYQLFEDNWREAADVFKPYLILILLRSSQPIKLSAGGFMEVNMASFSSVISSSYSYFNLMFTSKS